ncbi:MAG: desulfoferrodoxin family protein, partial [Megasphaera sp.]|nr:desulfoferrodoxin family protein [Megasphaera sp.]
MKHVEFYRNDADGKVLVVVGAQAPEEVIYAGQKLTHLVAGSVDAAQEKHVPCIQKIDNHLEVQVGSVIHPMEEKHYIEWIALV